MKGGIKAGGREIGGKNWWGKQWTQVLEGFNLGARLSRGRSYARQGQVISLDIGKGTVTAAVQGSRAKPYQVKLKIKVLTQELWQQVIKRLSSEVIYSAKLLAGEMPADIETIFAAAGVSLFPEREKDLETDCSCPDWSNPCKHIAAVYYVLGQEFDRDPFLIFKLRGLEREELFGKLSTTETISQSQPVNQPEPLPVDPVRFWSGEVLPEGFLNNIQTPPVSPVVLQQLGNFPLWRGKEELVKSLKSVYVNASNLGFKVTIGKNDFLKI
ncbi:SWIM zinc finger family protein [Desulforamulus ruminis]